MTQFEKRRKKLFRKPIPNDMTEEEIISIAEQYGCTILTGGNHQHRIVYAPDPDCPIQRKVIPIPSHGKSVPEIVIKELKQLIVDIENYEGGPRNDL